MEVVFDGSVCFDGFGACYQYYTQMAPRLEALGCRITVTASPTGVLERGLPPSSVSLRMPKPRLPWLPAGRARRWLSQLKRHLESQAVAVRARGPVLFQSFYYTVPPHPDWHLVGMVLDCIPEKFPSLFQSEADLRFIERKAECVRRARHILAISQTTADDLIALHGCDPTKVSVVPLGIDPSAYQLHLRPDQKAAWLKRLGIKGPFVLQVGGRQKHKNFLGLLDALALYSRRGKLSVVCAGEPWDPVELDRIRALRLMDKVHLVRRPDPQTLLLLFHSAEALVYPSLYEGFGIPPLEAMASLLPVLASDRGSIPEVVGEAALLFDPENPHSLCEAMQAVRDPLLAAELRTKGERRVQQFHWGRTAQQTLEVYLKVQAVLGLRPQGVPAVGRVLEAGG